MIKNSLQYIKQRFGIVGNSRALNHSIEIAMQVAPTNMSILIHGENGSGKESFSKILHALSPYKHGKLIPVNCGSIPEGTIDSELFGHQKGSFTGAIEARKGYFEEADKGTIFLDEIGEMPLSTQAKLLRILEYGEFIRVGSSKVEKTQTRIIAATHVDLLEATAKGKFREDLYYRINTIPLYIPPLRKRSTDIPLLFKKFASDFCAQHHTKPIRLTQEAEELLIQYPFPGNIRQLKNLVTQMSALEYQQPIISVQTLKNYLPQKAQSALVPQASTSYQEPTPSEREILYKVLFDMQKDIQALKRLLFEQLRKDTSGTQLIKANATLFSNLPDDTQHPQTLHRLTTSDAIPIKIGESPKQIGNEQEEENLRLADREKELISKALKKHGYKRKYAAKSLGIAERTLYRKIKTYNL